MLSRVSFCGFLVISLTSIAAAEPMTPEARFEKAITLLQAGHYNDAIPLLEELTRTVPKAANVYWNLGLADEAIGAKMPRRQMTASQPAALLPLALLTDR